MNEIKLSILIPTYKYEVGLKRILEAVTPIPADVEVVIFDDTPGFDVKKIADFFVKRNVGITYQHNKTTHKKSLGACWNWNLLLDAAVGDYVVLMHHDELPMNKNFVNLLRTRLTDQTNLDVYMLDVMLLDDKLVPLRRHVPYWMRRLALRLVPSYLFRRNVIGPTGALVIRRECAPRFDTRLRWLVDVEFYYQLIKKSGKWGFASEICVGSVLRKDGTITARLSDRLAQVDAWERRLLAMRYPEAWLWLKTRWGAPLLWVEVAIWYSFRVLQWIICRINGLRRVLRYDRR